MQRWMVYMVMMMAMLGSTVLGEGTGTVVPTQYTGTFYYSSEHTEATDYGATYYYDDAYFVVPATTYQPSLATMSLCLALATSGSNVDGTSDYTYKARNAVDLLEQIGCEASQIVVNEAFGTKPTDHSIGLVAAHKRIMVGDEAYTLLILTTRGAGYEAEWAGNFYIGSEGPHQGFAVATDTAYAFLEDYVRTYGDGFESKVKVWLTGYSRGAAVANMLAGRLNDEQELAGIPLCKEDSYVYGFEVPMGVMAEDVLPLAAYDNIHNIIHEDDLMTKLAPAQWGFARYGVDYPLPTPANCSDYAEREAVMLRHLKDLDTDYARQVTAPGVEKLDLGDSLDDVVQNWVTELGSREGYVEKVQTQLQTLFRLLYGSGRKGSGMMPSWIQEGTAAHQVEVCLAWMMAQDNHYR